MWLWRVSRNRPTSTTSVPGVERHRAGKWHLLPAADLFEEVPEARASLLIGTEGQHAWGTVVPDLKTPFRMPQNHSNKSAPAVCPAK